MINTIDLTECEVLLPGVHPAPLNSNALPAPHKTAPPAAHNDNAAPPASMLSKMIRTP